MKNLASRILTAAVIAIFALALAAPVSAQPAAGQKKGPSKKELEDLKGNFMKLFEERLKHRFSPVVKKVTAGAAKVGSPIAITVQAGYDTPRAVDKITEAKIYYSSDGGKKWNRPVKLSKSGADWKGAIPAPAAKGTLTYYVWLKDSWGNVTSELPCKVAAWPPVDDGCMVRGAASPAGAFALSKVIAPDINVEDFHVGMDDNYIYLQQTVEGNVKKGSLSPMLVNSYMALAFDLQIVKLFDFKTLTAIMGNPDAAKKFKGKENMLKVMIYAPLAKAMMPEAKECSLLVMPSGAPAKGKGPGIKFDTKNLNCSAKGSDLYIRLNKASLPASMKKNIAIIGAFTISVTDPQGIPKFGVMLNVTNAVWNPRTIKVN